jgi:hypothetical protein
MRSHSSKSLRRTAVTGTVALAATAGLVGLAAPASAEVGKNGVCETGDLCLYFQTQQRGPVFDLFSADANFNPETFPGTQIAANNNTRSYRNRDNFYWRVYDGPNFTGTEILCIAPGDRGNFSTRDYDRASSARFSSTAC